jgi:predicted transcriptional regulator
MPLHLPPELEQRLAQLAAQTDRTPEELALEALESYLIHVESLIADVREAEESAGREGWLTHEEVFKRLNKRLLKPA